jgi:hypothetical protein
MFKPKAAKISMTGVSKTPTTRLSMMLGVWSGGRGGDR